jgi:hypothetical protein
MAGLLGKIKSRPGFFEKRMGEVADEAMNASNETPLHPVTLSSC